MGLGSAAQLLAGIFPAGVFTIIAMNPWFSVALMATGFIYLIATMALNYFKQDSVGWWLRKCCWSRTLAYRYAETAEGEQEEVRALMEVQLSPQVHAKSTVHYEDVTLAKAITTA
ncbi:membrane protein [Pseudomonas syringae pv. cerasicola]|nr:membrane protein [Pseudomonas syringae pv. cerasicola]